MPSDDSTTGDDVSPSRIQSATILKDKLQTFTYKTHSSSNGMAPKDTSPMLRYLRKRGVDGEDAGAVDNLSPPKKKRSTKKERSAGDAFQVENNLVDSLRPDLLLVLIGLNPGLTTAATGHAYAHSSNLYWKLLHWSGITPVRHAPSDTQSLPDLYSIGNTNICARPTRTGDGLSKEELEEGAHILEEKIAHYQPHAVCIVGKGIWDTIYKVKTGKVLKKGEFSYGWQKEALWLGRVIDSDGSVISKGSRTFVATTTSGLAAGMSTEQKTDVWKPLGTWLKQHRATLSANGNPDEQATQTQETGIKVETTATAATIVKLEDE